MIEKEQSLIRRKRNAIESHLVRRIAEGLDLPAYLKTNKDQSKEFDRYELAFGEFLQQANIVGVDIEKCMSFMGEYLMVQMTKRGK